MPKAISKAQLKSLLAKVLDGQKMKKRRSKTKSKGRKKHKKAKKSISKDAYKSRKPTAYNRFFGKAMRAMKLKGKPRSVINEAAKKVGAMWRAKKGR